MRRSWAILRQKLAFAGKKPKSGYQISAVGSETGRGLVNTKREWKPINRDVLWCYCAKKHRNSTCVPRTLLQRTIYINMQSQCQHWVQTVRCECRFVDGCIFYVNLSSAGRCPVKMLRKCGAVIFNLFHSWHPQHIFHILWHLFRTAHRCNLKKTLEMPELIYGISVTHGEWLKH